MTVRAALWARVSKGEQHPENQRLALEAEVARRGGREIVRVWEFDASAWKGDHAPELAELLKATDEHRYDELYIWALDRLERRGPIDALLTCRRIFSAGRTIVSIQDRFLEQEYFREPMIAIMAWLAERESRRRSERIKAGLERRKAEGKPVGRQPGAKGKR